MKDLEYIELLEAEKADQAGWLADAEENHDGRSAHVCREEIANLNRTIGVTRANMAEAAR